MNQAVEFVAPGEVDELTESCSSGKKVTGGGFNIGGGSQGTDPNLVVLDNRPTGDGTGWYVRVRNNNDPDGPSAGALFRAYAICASV
jgi:hypothetical protein